MSSCKISKRSNFKSQNMAELDFVKAVTMKFAVLGDVRQCNAYRLQNFLSPSFFFHTSTSPVCHGLLIVEVS